MHQQRRLRIAVSLLVCILLHAEGADKYTDENRPYEFGFNVEIGGNKQQHRHEKKDKDGLIMGEFGFVTADDVYHVTVYATDKEGRFKILSMKNIYLKSSPAPSGPALSTRQGHSLALSPTAPSTPASFATPLAQANIIPQPGPVSQAKTPFKPIVLQPPARSCSSCSLPTTTPRAPPPAPPANFVPQNQPNIPPSLPASFVPQNQQGFPPSPTSFVSQNQPSLPPTLPASFVPQNQQGFPPPPTGFVPQNQQSFPPTQPADLPPQSQQRFPGPNPVSFAPQNQPSFSAPPPGNFVPQNQQNLPAASPAFTNNVQHGGIPNQPLGPQAGQPSYPQSVPIGTESAPLQPPNVSQQNYPSSPSSVSIPNAPNSYAQQGFEQSPAIGSRSGVPQSFSNEQPDRPQYSVGGSTAQGLNPQGGPGSRISKQYTGSEQQFGSNPRGPGPVKPTLVSAQMQIVDKNTDIHALRPGEKQGLPPGLNNNDMTQLLYTFNYTVGFHGHFEEGYRNGAKKGYYFVTGRNGVRTRIDYTADETGFHPRVSQEVLDLLSDDVPKPETEKDDKYGLKGYEFKWLYYPPDERNA